MVLPGGDDNDDVGRAARIPQQPMEAAPLSLLSESSTVASLETGNAVGAPPPGPVRVYAHYSRPYIHKHDQIHIPRHLSS